jgi:phosphoribosyl-ATP pyrophosphohydrolase/phosphoribosyl-AMP cyclohydrolase
MTKPKSRTAKAKKGEPKARAKKPAAGKEAANGDVAVRSKDEAPAPAAPGDGVQVLSQGGGKFSMADIEALRAAIKIKGAGTTVEGINFDEIKWDADGLVPVVAQDRRTGAVLMLSWSNRDTLESSLKTKQMSYFDRARGKVISKTEGTGRAQRLVTLALDCDKDAILATVEQDGPACHRDTGTCWVEGRAQPLASFVGELDRIVAKYAKDPKPHSHTSKLLGEPIEALRKLVEKANDTVRTIQGKSTKEPLEHEAADLLYHLLVACRTKGVGLERIVNDLYAQHLADQVKKAA